MLKKLAISHADPLNPYLKGAVHKVFVETGIPVGTLDHWLRDKELLEDRYSTEIQKKDKRKRKTYCKRFSAGRKPMFPNTESTLSDEIQANIDSGKKYLGIIFPYLTSEMPKNYVMSPLSGIGQARISPKSRKSEIL